MVPYLKNMSIPNEEHLLADRTIRRKAFQAYAKTDFRSKLFINIKPTWIYKFIDYPEHIPTISG
jgi:hypothetical protein